MCACGGGHCGVLWGTVRLHFTPSLISGYFFSLCSLPQGNAWGGADKKTTKCSVAVQCSVARCVAECKSLLKRTNGADGDSSFQMAHDRPLFQVSIEVGARHYNHRVQIKCTPCCEGVGPLQEHPHFDGISKKAPTHR